MVTTNLTTRCTGGDAVERAIAGLELGSRTGSTSAIRERFVDSRRRSWTLGELNPTSAAATAAYGAAVPAAAQDRWVNAAPSGTSFADVAGFAHRGDLRATTNPIPTDGVTSVSDQGPPV